MAKFKVTDEVLKDLMSDWLTRDGETFTHIRKHGTVDWEKKIPDHGSLSDYLFPEDYTRTEIVKKSREIAEGMVVAMDTPYKVKIKVSPHSSSTDSKKVFVASDVFDNPHVSTGFALDVFCGLAIHEGCHLLYTDFSVMRDGSRMKSELALRISHTFFNIMEDERIEELLGDTKPGFAKFTARSKYYYFDKMHEREPLEGDLLKDLTNIFLKVIRYPKYLTEEEVREYADFLFAIKRLVIPYPDSTKATLEVADDITELVLNTIEDKMEEKKSEVAKSEGSEDKADGRTTILTSKDIRDALTDSEKKEGEETSKESSDDKPSDDKSSGKKGKVKLSTAEKAALERLLLDSTFDISKSMEESKVGTSGKELTYKDVSDSISAHDYLEADKTDGEVMEGAERNALFLRAEENKDVYMDDYSKIARYIPMVSKALICHSAKSEFCLHSMRSGNLDGLKMAEAVQGVPNVYIRKGEKFTDTIAVGVLIDESGSMSGGEDEHEKYKMARQMAILLNESLKRVGNVQYFIYGHSADEHYVGSAEIRIYHDPSYTNKYTLGSCTYRRENRDGNAIYNVCRRIRKFTDKPAILFVLSDGSPLAGGYHGSFAIEHTRKCVQKSEALGFTIIQISIDGVYDPSQMFRHYLKMTDISSLAKNMGILIKKEILSSSKTHIRM